MPRPGSFRVTFDEVESQLTQVQTNLVLNAENASGGHGSIEIVLDQGRIGRRRHSARLKRRRRGRPRVSRGTTFMPIVERSRSTDDTMRNAP
jgi:hypothetical protein